MKFEFSRKVNLALMFWYTRTIKTFEITNRWFRNSEMISMNNFALFAW